jgi:hypothetical protein
MLAVCETVCIEVEVTGSQGNGQQTRSHKNVGINKDILGESTQSDEVMCTHGSAGSSLELLIIVVGRIR